MEANTSRAEAERLLGISEKLLQSRDLNGSQDFAVLAQKTEPLLDGSDHIITVIDVLLAADGRVNNQHDWYSILGSGDDSEQIKSHYRHLALFLHPDKNRFPFADHAFRLVAQAWSVLSDSHLSFAFFTRVDFASSSNLPVRRTGTTKARTFWTLCPYCYVLSEYPLAFEDCSLRCQRCGKPSRPWPCRTPRPLPPARTHSRWASSSADPIGCLRCSTPQRRPILHWRRWGRGRRRGGGPGCIEPIPSLQAWLWTNVHFFVVSRSCAVLEEPPDDITTVDFWAHHALLVQQHEAQHFRLTKLALSFCLFDWNLELKSKLFQRK